MSVTLGIFFGIITMLGWGISDFFIAKAVRKTGVIKTALWSQTIGLALFFIAFPFFYKKFFLSVADIIVLLIAALFMVIAYLAFYKGLHVGRISVVGPVSASAASVTVILSIIFLNETLTLLQAIGVSLAILGAILVSFKFDDLSKLRIKKIAIGAKYGLIAMIGWGLAFVLIDVSVSNFGWFLPLFFIKTLGVVYMLIYFRATQKSFNFPKDSALFVFIIGILEAVAFLSYGVGVNHENTALVAPIAFAAPAITIILARIFFKEILELNQKIGVVAVLIGLVLLGV